MPDMLVVALGGNAITRPGEPGTIPQQFAHTAETLAHLLPLFRSGHKLVLTHGNGPQIGNILIRVEEGERRVPPLPLDTCVADSQGGMGYMIQRLATELFRQQGIRREVATVITQVLVDKNDPDFADPTKPIGSFHSAEEMERLRREKPHWQFREVGQGCFRRVVPSPRPLDILEKNAISELAEQGTVVIACGGGGIPVAWEGDSLAGVEAVIDKDRASSLLASQIRAHKLVIVTSVDQVAIRYGQADEERLKIMDLAQARKYLAAGEFPPGSMGPKIEAAIDFLEKGGEECIISSTERIAEAFAGNAGTRITAAWGRRVLAYPPLKT